MVPVVGNIVVLAVTIGLLLATLNLKRRGIR